MPYKVRIINSEGDDAWGNSMAYKKSALKAANKASESNPECTVELWEIFEGKKDNLLVHTIDPTAEAEEEAAEAAAWEAEEEAAAAEEAEQLSEDQAKLKEIAAEHGYRKVPSTSRGARSFYKKVFGNLPHKNYQNPEVVLGACVNGEELPPPPKKERPKSANPRPASVNSGALGDRKFGRREKVYDGGDDDIAVRLANCETIGQMSDFASEYGISDIEEKYGHLSNGLIRMNIGNRIRGAIKKKRREEAKAAAAAKVA